MAFSGHGVWHLALLMVCGFDFRFIDLIYIIIVPDVRKTISNQNVSLVFCKFLFYNETTTITSFIKIIYSTVR